MLARCQVYRLLMSIDQREPTNQQPLVQTRIEQPLSPPTCYISVRITTPHSTWPQLEAVTKNVDWYICYPHFGTKSENEHFHLFLPAPNGDSSREFYRNRIKRAGFTGNRQFSCKSFENGITSAISYGAKEKTRPYTHGDVSQWISSAPEWVDLELKPTAGKRKREDPLGIRISCVNMLKLAWQYREYKGLHSDELETVLSLMLRDGYYFDSNLVRQAAPDFYLEVFKNSCEKCKLLWEPKLIKNNLFRTPRQTW